MRIGGDSLQARSNGVLADVAALGGNGGLIAVAPSGEAAWGFTTPGCYRALAGPAAARSRSSARIIAARKLV